MIVFIRISYYLGVKHGISFDGLSTNLGPNVNVDLAPILTENVTITTDVA